MNHYMQKLRLYLKSLSFILLCNTAIAHSMEPQKDNQLTPITFAQTYHYLSKFLVKDVVRLIFSLHLDASGIDHAELPTLIKLCYNNPCSFVNSIYRLLKPGNHSLVTEIFKRDFTHTELSICASRDYWNGSTILHNATRSLCPVIVTIILNIAGNDKYMLLTRNDNSSDSALHLAAYYHSPDIVNLLLNAAGDNKWPILTAKNNTHNTALHVAAFKNSLDIANLLLNAAGENKWPILIAKNNNHDTALHLAAFKNSLDIVNLLLNAAGENAQKLMAICNRYKKTAFDIAMPEAKAVMEKYRKNNQ